MSYVILVKETEIWNFKRSVIISALACQTKLHTVLAENRYDDLVYSDTCSPLLHWNWWN